MLNDLKVILNITDTSKDVLLTLLIERCTEEAENYTRNSDVSSLRSAIIAMVCYQYNLLSCEGLSSENYSGVSFTYETEYPESIIRQLKAKRRVGVIND